ncbi:hypothetical protein QNH41_11075 [Bacillus halotolerans]|uniref:hypothetical protein n=1 Tax=Bacillus halotolerans TaxID=260554 RepID=UPI0024C1A969|nr:hypothetical protein [Bacillus halotolerans]WHY22604.1 hypothetical protein QNH41_11075 [Bacillus halotolerans]
MKKFYKGLIVSALSISTLALPSLTTHASAQEPVNAGQVKQLGDSPISVLNEKLYDDVPKWRTGTASCDFTGVYSKTRVYFKNYTSKKVNYKITKGSTTMETGTIAGNDTLTTTLTKPLLNSSRYLVVLTTDDSSNGSVYVGATGLD